MLDAPPEVCAALEYGRPLPVPKLEALRTFTLAVLERTGDVTAAEWQHFLEGQRHLVGDFQSRLRPHCRAGCRAGHRRLHPHHARQSSDRGAARLKRAAASPRSGGMVRTQSEVSPVKPRCLTVRMSSNAVAIVRKTQVPRFVHKVRFRPAKGRTRTTARVFALRGRRPGRPRRPRLVFVSRRRRLRRPRWPRDHQPLRRFSAVRGRGRDRTRRLAHGDFDLLVAEAAREAFDRVLGVVAGSVQEARLQRGIDQ
jgi:hypothetical protein